MAACGGGSKASHKSADASSNATDVCSLVTREEAETAWGGSLPESAKAPDGKDNKGQPIAVCQLLASGTDFLSIGVRRRDVPRNDFEQEADLARSNAGSGFGAVEGVGDAAYFYGITGAREVGTLVAFNGHRVLEVRVSAAKPVRPIAEAVARAAISRLR